MIGKTFDFLFRSVPNPNGDPFMNLPLIGAAYPIVLINFAYAFFVLRYGPRWMEHRPPFKVRGAMLIYNVLQITINVFLFVKATKLVVGNWSVYNLGCMSSLPMHHPEKVWEVVLMYGYYLIKLLDYVDTIFFVLRKSYKQVTFLHVYHHIMMSTSTYLYVRTQGYGGHLSFIGIINSLVHAVMYSYYLLTALRPNMQSAFWWKRYITIMQLVQFALIVLQQTWPIFFWQSCTATRIWIIIGASQALLMVYLFGNFYYKTYCGAAALRSQHAAKGSSSATAGATQPAGGIKKTD